MRELETAAEKLLRREQSLLRLHCRQYYTRIVKDLCFSMARQSILKCVMV